MTRTRGEVAITVVLAVLVVWLGFGQLNTVKDRQVAEVERTTLQNAYEADLRAYDGAVAARELCLDGVANSLKNRGQWQVAVNELRKGGLDPAADALEAGPLLSAPARTTAECPILPLEPTPPGEQP